MNMLFDFAINSEDLSQAIAILVQSMVGIFVVMIIISLIVYLLSKFVK